MPFMATQNCLCAEYATTVKCIFVVTQLCSVVLMCVYNDNYLCEVFGSLQMSKNVTNEQVFAVSSFVSNTVVTLLVCSVHCVFVCVRFLICLFSCVSESTH